MLRSPSDTPYTVTEYVSSLHNGDPIKTTHIVSEYHVNLNKS